MTINNDIIKILEQYSNEINFDYKLIYRIHIIAYDKLNEWNGKVELLNVNNNLCFELLLQQNVIDNLSSTNNELVMESLSVIFHELYHCKEMYVVSQNTQWENIYFHAPIDTTKLLLLQIGSHQWSEYYAYYNSSKIYQRKIDLVHKLTDAMGSAIVLYNTLDKSDILDVQMQLNDIHNFEQFIHYCVMLVAHYNSTHGKLYQKELNFIKGVSICEAYYPYLMDISSHLDSLYATFPYWVSEYSFIELGCKLLSFIRIHGLTFSTQDYSDNFILIKM